MRVFATKGNIQTKVKTAEEKLKSIKVLSDMPANQRGKMIKLLIKGSVILSVKESPTLFWLSFTNDRITTDSI